MAETHSFQAQKPGKPVTVESQWGDHRGVRLSEEPELRLEHVEFEVKEGRPGENVSCEAAEPFSWM